MYATELVAGSWAVVDRDERLIKSGFRTRWEALLWIRQLLSR